MGRVKTPPPHPTHFRDHYALTALPWFERDAAGALVVDPDVGPIVDVHTHLALQYLRPMQVDLEAEHPRTELYLPFEAELDLDVYANRNFTPAHMSAIHKDLGIMTMTRRGMRVTHTAPDLLRDMAALGVTHSVLLPIDLPRISDNAGAYLKAAAAHPGGLISFGSVHPFAGDVVGALDRQVALGARGVKVHPAIQMLPPDHPKALRLYRLCAERELVVLWHCGPVDIETRLGRWFSQLKHYWRAVLECPETTFVLGHSGALQFEMALELAQRYPNAYLEIASQSVTNVRRIVREAPADRVLFGSDWPFYSAAMPLAKALIATDGATGGDPGLRAPLLSENAARLFGIDVPCA